MGWIRPTLVIVTMPTRLKKLRARYGTVAQAAFVLGQAQAHKEVAASVAQSAVRSRKKPTAAPEAEFAEYEREDSAFQTAVEQIRRDIEELDLPVTVIDREFIPNFDFGGCETVIVIGQDGLVANVAKYVGEVPIVGVNPDPRRIDGVLLPFQVDQARRAVKNVLDKRFRHRTVTLAEVNLNDGQRLLAFNDFFVGSQSHVSARYVLEVSGTSEPQSSSGILISTGAGSTGWLSSIFNMTSGIARLLGHEMQDRLRLNWEERRLLWAVREPFVSRHSQANLVAGMVDEGQQLTVESLMPAGGVIFSDGIESDFLTFTSGTIARIGVSQQKARLVVP
jgi:NAD kinase